MNQTETTLKVTLMVATLLVLSSCGVTKSSEPSNTENNFSSSSYKPLASCNKKSTADLSISSAAIVDQVGQVDASWLKVKFNFLSTTTTASGNIIRFFKWKVTNGATYLDQTPLAFVQYNISSGVSNNTGLTQVTASTVNAATGYYLQLNDTAGTYQAIKAVVYSSAGAVVSQTDMLIPQFNSKLGDYQYNSDGSARSSTLQAIHPLVGVTTSGWSDAQYDSYFQAFCF